MPEPAEGEAAARKLPSEEVEDEQPNNTPANGSSEVQAEVTEVATEPAEFSPSKTGRGRGRGRNRGRGRAGRGKRQSGAKEPQQEDKDSEDAVEATGQALPRRTSRRERLKPQAYSPTHQDRDTKIRREQLKREASRGTSAAQSEEPESPKKAVKEESTAREPDAEAGGKSDDSDDAPLVLSARPSEPRTASVQAPEVKLEPEPSGEVDPQTAQVAKVPVLPDLNGNTGEAGPDVEPSHPLQEQSGALQAVNSADAAAPAEAAADRETERLAAAEVPLVPTKTGSGKEAAAGIEPAVADGREVQGKAKVGGVESMEVQTAAADVGKDQGSQDDAEADAAAEDVVMAEAPPPQEGVVKPEPDIEVRVQKEAAADSAQVAGGGAAREVENKGPHSTDGIAEAVAAAEEQPQAAQEGSVGGKAKEGKLRKRGRGSELDSSDEGAVEPPVDDGDWNPAEGEVQRRSTSVESEGPVKPAGRKRLRKAADDPAQQQKARKKTKVPQSTIVAGEAVKETRQSIGAGKAAGAKTPGGVTVAKASAAGKGKSSDAAKNSQQKPQQGKSQPKSAPARAVGSKPEHAKAAEPEQQQGAAVVPGGTKDQLKQEVARRNDRLLAGAKQCNEIFQRALQQAGDVLWQMGSDIQELDGVTMTEAILSQTGIGKTMRSIAKPLKALQPLRDVEKNANTLVSRWMSTFNTPAGAPAGGSGKQGQPPSVRNTTPAAPTAKEQQQQPPAQAAAQASSIATTPAPQKSQEQPSLLPSSAVVQQPNQSAQPVIANPAQGLAPKAVNGNAGAAAAQDSKDQAVRSKARMILESAFMPQDFKFPPNTAANWLEAALYQHYKEEDLYSGKRYLRRLQVLCGWLAPESNTYKPSLREMLAKGRLHPADLATMPTEDVDAITQQHMQLPAPTADGMPPPPPISLPPETHSEAAA